MNIEHVRLRVRQASAWCAPRARADDARTSLRSPELVPAGLAFRSNLPDGSGGWRNQEFMAGRNLDAFPVRERAPLVEHVATARAALLPVAHGVAPGRLLVHHPDLNLWDGGADASSFGFFDDTDAPPWDSWIAYVWDGGEAHNGFLLSWVPQDLVAVAARGVAECISGSLAWAQDLDHPLLRALRTEEHGRALRG